MSRTKLIVIALILGGLMAVGFVLMVFVGIGFVLYQEGSSDAQSQAAGTDPGQRQTAARPTRSDVPAQPVEEEVRLFALNDGSGLECAYVFRNGQWLLGDHCLKWITQPTQALLFDSANRRSPIGTIFDDDPNFQRFTPVDPNAPQIVVRRSDQAPFAALSANDMHMYRGSSVGDLVPLDDYAKRRSANSEATNELWKQYQRKETDAHLATLERIREWGRQGSALAPLPRR